MAYEADPTSRPSDDGETTVCSLRDSIVYVHDAELIPKVVNEKALEPTNGDESGDPSHPRNWTPRYKWLVVAIVALYNLIPPLASSMMAPSLKSISSTYNITNPTISAMTLSIFLLSFAFAPLIMAPLSEIYGRAWILHLGNIFLMLANLGCAFSPTVGALLVFRFLSGIGGAASIACGGAVIHDMFASRDLAVPMSLYSLGPLIGPALGPMAGGLISQNFGFKWSFVAVAGLCAVSSLIAIPFMRESYAPVVIARQQRKMSDVENPPSLPSPSPMDSIVSSLTRPLVLLTRSIICFMLSLYMSLMYGIYYLMFVAFSPLFESYGWDQSLQGLAYIGLGIGFLLATVFGARVGDRIYKTLADKNGGHGTPEHRLPALLIGSIFVPIGLLWYGWSAQQKLHWIMPIIGTTIFGFGAMSTFTPILLYLCDAFSYSASALAAALVFRSLLGFAFPLFGQAMYRALGYGGGNTLLAGLSIALGVPFPVFLYIHGASMRARSSLTK